METLDDIKELYFLILFGLNKLQLLGIRIEGFVLKYKLLELALKYCNKNIRALFVNIHPGVFVVTSEHTSESVLIILPQNI